MNDYLNRKMGGLCGIISKLYRQNLITYPEKTSLIDSLIVNKPLVVGKSKYWQGTAYWWTPMFNNQRATAPRIKFVKELIKISK